MEMTREHIIALGLAEQNQTACVSEVMDILAIGASLEAVAGLFNDLVFMDYMEPEVSFSPGSELIEIGMFDSFLLTEKGRLYIASLTPEDVDNMQNSL